MTPEALAGTLEKIGQSSVLRFMPRLDDAGQAQLLGQLSRLDLDTLPDLVARNVTGKYTPPIPKHFEPATPMPRVPTTPDQKALYERARARGQQLLKEGRIGAFVVAGGQGTRLGFDGPKGEYPVTPIKNKPLFQVFAEQLLAHSRRSSKTIPWYIMTSETNDGATRAFFQKHSYFGYDPSAVSIFPQGMMPAFSLDGQMLLAAKDSLALSPGGNGDCYRSLHRSGALADMRKRGVTHLSYFNVDNPLVQCIDELFLGLHDLTGSDMSSKAIPKSSAKERVGNFAIADGKLQVIEYSDIPDEVATQKNPDGSLRFSAGSIGIHAMRVEFIERLTSGELHMPWHRAEKKVPYVDALGNTVTPDKPNAVKLELFVFDVLPFAKNPMVYMTERAEEFSPVKNADGNDSPATCRRDQIRRAARWLEACGISVPHDNKGDIEATIEISPLFAANAEQLREKRISNTRIVQGQSIYLE